MLNLDPWLLEAYEQFSKSLSEGRLSHSLIIAGDPALGSAKLVKECVKLYLCGNPVDGRPCNQCQSCRLFNENSHPDFLAALSSTAQESEDNADVSHRPDDLDAPKSNAQRSVRVKTIRKLSEWIFQGSVLGSGKAAVIANACHMSEEAANALLKTFEEPPKDTLIILLAKSLDLLLPTLLSRAVKIQLKEVSFNQGLEFMQQNQAPRQRAAAALRLAKGAPYKALSIIQDELDIKAQSLLRRLEAALLSKGDDNGFIGAALECDEDFIQDALKEFVLELLKYKAGVNVKTLPLLSGLDVNKLASIKALRLFAAMDQLNRQNADIKKIPSRTPKSRLYAWLQDLRTGDNR